MNHLVVLSLDCETNCGGVSMRVLIVEDDRSLGAFLKTGLGLEGHRVEWVEDGEAALAHVSADHPDLILDRKSTRLNSSHANISYGVFWLRKTTESGLQQVLPHVRPVPLDISHPVQRG